MSPGAETNPSNMHLTRSSSSNYDAALKNWDSNTDQTAINRWCIVNSNSNWYTTLKVGTRLVYSGKLDIRLPLTIKKATSHDYLTSSRNCRRCPVTYMGMTNNPEPTETRYCRESER